MDVPSGLRLLAQWFDLYDVNHPETAGVEIQKDLRTWAEEWEAAIQRINELEEEKRDRGQLAHERREVFSECLSDYERVRGYLVLRHKDLGVTQHEINQWLADNGFGVIVRGVPEAEAWRERFWPILAAVQKIAKEEQ